MNTRVVATNDEAKDGAEESVPVGVTNASMQAVDSQSNDEAKDGAKESVPVNVTHASVQAVDSQSGLDKIREYLDQCRQQTIQVSVEPSGSKKKKLLSPKSIVVSVPICMYVRFTIK